MVLLLMNGSALAVNWATEHIAAIVEVWYPGQAGGEAIADVLFGDFNPGGRLPVTFYRSLDDLPPFDDYRMEGHTYRYFRGEPLFPFGHGLSYTSFAYTDLCLSSESLKPGDSLTIRVSVTNTGERAGNEVVQLYVSDVDASVPVPIRQLQGFERIYLDAGEAATVAFNLMPQQLAVIDDAGKQTVEPGEFRVAVGGRQPTREDLVQEASDIVVGSFVVSSD
jgi:beta-glucosidase